ncbi:hypothetical protein EDC04DRAFT_448864 [Pisolithus marmoratus]|nr:hypothetical protein EDC04DRAFT_448864 [Pisolithus marmoratus]
MLSITHATFLLVLLRLRAPGIHLRLCLSCINPPDISFPLSNTPSIVLREFRICTSCPPDTSPSTCHTPTFLSETSLTACSCVPSFSWGYDHIAQGLAVGRKHFNLASTGSALLQLFLQGQTHLRIMHALVPSSNQWRRRLHVDHLRLTYDSTTLLIRSTWRSCKATWNEARAGIKDTCVSSLPVVLPLENYP